MSKTVELEMDCPNCKAAFTAKLYRTIWVEYPENLDLIATDRINVVRCPACGLSERQPFPFLATNVAKHVAVWYEPIPDPNIDVDVALYRQHYGDDSYFAKAPRIKNWEEFKSRLIELNKGPDVTPSIGDFFRLRQRMRSAHAEVVSLRRHSTTSRPVGTFGTWIAKLRRSFTSEQFVQQTEKTDWARAGALGTDTDGGEKLSKTSPAQVNPITKLDQAISTWDRGQARIALAIFAATIFNDRTPLESLFGKGAKIETAIERLTVGQLRVLHSIMTEIAPDN